MDVTLTIFWCLFPVLVSVAGNRCQSSGARNHDTLCQQLISADTTKVDSDFENLTEIHFFILFYELKNAFITALHFHLCLHTNELCYRLLGLTINSSAFQPVSGTKVNMLYSTQVSGTRKIWHRKSMTHWPVSGTIWLVPETGQCVITIMLPYLTFLRRQAVSPAQHWCHISLAQCASLV